MNDDLLVDFGPDVPAQAQRFNRNLAAVKHVLFTHGHDDHLSGRDMHYRSRGYHRATNLPVTTVWANPTARAKLEGDLHRVIAEEFGGYHRPDLRPTRAEALEEVEDFLRLRLTTIAPYETYHIGRYEVTTIRANHNQPERALNFLIRDDRSTFMYATDTGLWDDRTWAFLEESAVKIDVIALDCTVGGEAMSGGHHSNNSFLATREGLLARDLLADPHLFLAHHFSHQDNWPYARLREYMASRGVEVTYDGMVVDTIPPRVVEDA